MKAGFRLLRGSVGGGNGRRGVLSAWDAGARRNTCECSDRQKLQAKLRGGHLESRVGELIQQLLLTR